MVAVTRALQAVGMKTVTNDCSEAGFVQLWT